MGYYGGLGQGRGWHKLFFLLTPEELREVFFGEPLLLIDTGRVEEGKWYTDAATYAEAYRAFTIPLVRGEPISHLVTRPLIVWVTYPEARFEVERFEAEGRWWGLLKPEEPMLRLSFFEIHYDGKTLFTNTLSSHDQVYFGLELDFPRAVYFARERYEVEHDTASYPNAAVFARLRARIHSLTRPCRIESPSRVHRTPIRISPAMREAMQGNRRLAAQGLRVV